MLIHVGIKLCEIQIKSCNSIFASVMLNTFYIEYIGENHSFRELK